MYTFGIDGEYTHGVPGLATVGTDYTSHPDYIAEGDGTALVEEIRENLPDTTSVEIDLSDVDETDRHEILDALREAGYDVVDLTSKI